MDRTGHPSAADYSTHARHQRKIAFRLLSEHYEELNQLPFPVNVLDLGCKTGEITKLLTYIPNVGEVKAVDPGVDMLAVAETFSSDARISYETGNPSEFHSLPIPAAENYHVVSVMDGFHFEPNPEKVLLTAEKCLVPGGVIIGYTSSFYSFPQPLLNFCASSSKWKPYTQVLERNLCLRDPFVKWRNVSPENVMGQMLEVAGFDVLRCTLEEDFMIFTKQEALGNLRTEKEIFESVPENRVEEFLKDIAESYLRTFQPLRTGHYGRSLRVLSILAKKRQD